MVQNSSSRSEPSMGLGGASLRRRYLMAKCNNSPAISRVKKTVIAISSQKTPSTMGAKVDACFGNSSNSSSMSLIPVARRDRETRFLEETGFLARSRKRLPPPFAKKTAGHVKTHEDDRRHAGDAHGRQRGEAIAARDRVVREARQQHAIHRRADLSLPGVHERQAQVARPVI